MKIAFPSIRFRYLHFDRIYKSDKVIIPIGCDCHPAYVLKKMHLREYSFPFDWVGSRSETTLFYVMDCIKTKFSKAFSDMGFNEERRVISKNYPNTRFTHEACIIHNKDVLKGFILRGQILSKLVENTDIYYLCNMKIGVFQGKEMADKLIQDITIFTQFIKENDSLHIYFTAEDDKEENQNIRDYLLLRLQEVAKVKTAPYYKNKARYGIWGDDKYYPTLLRQLGINIRKSLKIKTFTSS